MHFIPDADNPYGLAGQLLEQLPSGSYLALSHLTGDFDPAAWEGVAAVYRRSGVIMQVRSRPAVERFFAGLVPERPPVPTLGAAATVNPSVTQDQTIKTPWAIGAGRSSRVMNSDALMPGRFPAPAARPGRREPSARARSAARRGPRR